MKTKNLFLGVAATMFAVAGVTASSFMITANYVRVPTGPGGSFQCRKIDPVECGSGGAQICKAQVTGVAGGPYELYQTRSNPTTCTNLINTSPFAQLSEPVTLAD